MSNEVTNLAPQRCERAFILQKISRVFFKSALAGVLIIHLLGACKKDKENPPLKPAPKLEELDSKIAIKWADKTLYALRFSAFNTPTYSSRSLGYLGLCMYETLVPGDAMHKSMSGQLNGLVLPTLNMNEEIHWTLAVNAAQDTLIKLLYPVPGNSHRFIHESIDSLYNAIYEEESKNISQTTIDRSIKWGTDVALAIYNWSLTDGGDKAYTRNFVSTFPFPSGPSFWIPPIRGQTISLYPLHPYWGNNRTFAPVNGSLPVPAIIPYSTDTASAYYKIYKAVYDKDKLLTPTEMEIAAWWGDDPTETFSPPGHSYALATIAAKKSNPKIIIAAEAYARTGMAVADAFIRCWKAKYTYFNERPSSYVKKNIDANWVQFWPEPPFPAFPSGHSIQSAAAAEVLTAVYGDNFSFTDHSHVGFRRFDDVRFFDLRYPARSFNSFWEAALECAYSRFLGGIHTQQDNEAGTTQGKVIGANVNALQWRR